MAMQQYVQNLLADYADDQTLNDFKHAETFSKAVEQGKFSPSQLNAFRDAGMLTGGNKAQGTVTRHGMGADGRQITEPVSQTDINSTPLTDSVNVSSQNNEQGAWYNATDSWSGPTGDVDWQKNAGMMGLSTDEFNRFQNVRQELVNNAYDGRISEDEFNTEWLKLLDNFGVDPVVQGTDKTYFLDPGLPGVNPYGEQGNIKGVFGQDADLAGMYRRHAKTEGTDMPNEFSEIGPIATALAGGYFLGPALASQLGGGIVGAGGAGGLLTGANQALWGQDIDPESMAYAALTSGGLTGLNQFLNDGVLQPGMGLDSVDLTGAREATGGFLENIFGGPSSLETVTDVSTGEVLGDRISNTQFIDDAGRLQNINYDTMSSQVVTSQPVLGQALDAVGSVPGVTESATWLAELLNPELSLEGTPESVTYPNETFADPTGELATDPLTEAVMEEAFDPGSVEIVEGPDGEFVFVENKPEFNPDEITQIGVPEIESEGTGGTGEGVDEGDLNEEVFVDTTEDGDEDVVVESDLDQGEGEEVFVDVPNETEEVQIGDLDTPQRETSLVDQSGLPGMLMGGKGEGEFEPFMASVQTEFPLLQRLGITPQQYLAMLFARLQNQGANA